MSLVFYISGHGFGHASRDIEVINAIGARRPSQRIVVRTAVAEWLFTATLRTPVDFWPLECDTGIVQIDSLQLDARASVTRAHEFHATLDARALREAEFLRSQGARLVVGDIPPLAFAAAGRAGVPSIALGNFSWDWIYAGYEAEIRDAPGLIEVIEAAYGQTTEALRLPFAGGFAPFRTVTDVPLIARRSRVTPGEVRQGLGLPTGLPLVLVSFGGHGIRDLDLALIAKRAGVVLLGTHADGSGPLCREAAQNVFLIDEHRLYEDGWRYEDLVAAADVVATKPGFGIIAECIANDTAMLYTSRGRFIEYEVLVSEMPRYLNCEFISQEDLRAGRWDGPLQALLHRSTPPSERPRTDGADIVADRILQYL